MVNAKRKVIRIKPEGPPVSEYIPPTLEQSRSMSIAPLKDRHKGETCYIIGKGPSLGRLNVIS